jgi:hypothetical protein
MAQISTTLPARLSAAILVCSAFVAAGETHAQTQPIARSATGAATASAEIAPVMGVIDGMLLLKNGETLEGRISRSGDYYLIVSPTAEVQVRVREVEAICRDLEEVFAKKLTLVNTRSADSYLALAQWCIDKQLYGHAARTLTEAVKLDDLHPRIALLERRMEAAMAAPKPVPAPPKPVERRYNDDELDRAAKSVSAESMHEFTVRVQPLLMNYCATAGCHGPRPASTFQLERVYLNERSDQRTVRTNLNAVLKIVDRQNPAKSPLLNVPIAVHGNGKKPIFNAHNAEHYRSLAGWTARVAATRTATPQPSSADVVGVSNTLQQRLPIAPPTGTATPPPATVDLRTAVPLEAANSSVPAPITAAPGAIATPVVAPPAESTAPARAAGIDPFDADIFNRRREAEKK